MGKRPSVNGSRSFIPLSMVLCFLLLWCGCGGVDPGKMLRDCVEACEAYASGSNYLKFREEVLLELESGGQRLNQTIIVEGESIFPLSQSYLRQESWVYPEGSDTVAATDYRYLTLDGGKSVYVRGKKIESALGTSAWVYYVPPPGDNRYFDFARTVKLIAAEPFGLTAQEEGEGLRIRFKADLEEILRVRLEEVGQEWREEFSRFLDEGMGRELSVEVVLDRTSALPREIRAEVEARKEDVRAYTRLTWQFSGFWEEPPGAIEPPAFFIKAG